MPPKDTVAAAPVKDAVMASPLSHVSSTIVDKKKSRKKKKKSHSGPCVGPMLYGKTAKGSCQVFTIPCDDSKDPFVQTLTDEERVKLVMIHWLKFPVFCERPGDCKTKHPDGSLFFFCVRPNSKENHPSASSAVMLPPKPSGIIPSAGYCHQLMSFLLCRPVVFSNDTSTHFDLVIQVSQKVDGNSFGDVTWEFEGETKTRFDGRVAPERLDHIWAPIDLPIVFQKFMSSLQKEVQEDFDVEKHDE